MIQRSHCGLGAAGSRTQPVITIVPPMITPRVMVTWWRLRRAHIEMAADAERGGNRARGERREVIVHQHFSCQ